MTAVPQPGSGPARSSRVGRVASAASRIPVTLTAVAVLLTMGVLTGTLWRPAGDFTDGPLRRYAFGLPTLIDHRPGTFLTGAFVLPRPEFYLFVGGLLLFGLGAFERRVGGLRAAAALVGTHLAGAIGAGVLLAGLEHAHLPWAEQLATRTDLGL